MHLADLGHPPKELTGCQDMTDNLGGLTQMVGTDNVCIELFQAI
jgi:hypothetical protein